jgi:hypothetical protein
VRHAAPLVLEILDLQPAELIAPQRVMERDEPASPDRADAIAAPARAETGLVPQVASGSKR